MSFTLNFQKAITLSFKKISTRKICHLIVPINIPVNRVTRRLKGNIEPSAQDRFVQRGFEYARIEITIQGKTVFQKLRRFRRGLGWWLHTQRTSQSAT
jgi:hypothetical protein